MGSEEISPNIAPPLSLLQPCRSRDLTEILAAHMPREISTADAPLKINRRTTSSTSDNHSHTLGLPVSHIRPPKWVSAPVRDVSQPSIDSSGMVSASHDYCTNIDCAVYVKGKHLSYQRGKRNTNPNTSLLKIEGVDEKKDAQ